MGEDELAQGKVRIKQLGLPEGHAEKDGFLVNMDDMVSEVRKTLAKVEAETVNGVAEKLSDIKV